MLSMQVYTSPKSIDEAYDLLNSSRNNVILAGCGFLRLGKKKIGTGVDLKNLKLNYIDIKKEYIEIGSMTSLRKVETDLQINKMSNGIISKAISGIVGVPFRNTVTIGGSVYGKYGFSDLITALLAINAELVLHKAGLITIEEFLSSSLKKDILLAIRLPLKKSKGSYTGFRHSNGDFPILTIATTYSEDAVNIVVGARPMKAIFAYKAMKYLSNEKITPESISFASELAVDELTFGSNMRASADYRKKLAKTLIERSLLEVVYHD